MLVVVLDLMSSDMVAKECKGENAAVGDELQTGLTMRMKGRTTIKPSLPPGECPDSAVNELRK